MQTAWRPLDSVTGYFRGVAMFPDRIYNKNFGSRPYPIQNRECKLNQKKLNFARAAAIIWGNGGITCCMVTFPTQSKPIVKMTGRWQEFLNCVDSLGYNEKELQHKRRTGMVAACDRQGAIKYTISTLCPGCGSPPVSPFFLFFQFFLRGLIMADVQKEYGYTALANNYIEALAKIRIPGEANQCLLVIFRKTWGWNKKKDEISLSQFVEKTGICKPHVCRALSILIEMNIITVTKKGNGITEYSIQKDFEKWKPLPKKVTLPKKVIGVTKKGNAQISEKSPNGTDTTIVEGKKTKKQALPFWGHTKNTRIKPSSTKDTSIDESKNKLKSNKEWSPKIKFLVEEYFKTLTEGQQVRFEKQRDKFHSCCDKLLRIDGFSEEEIRKAINFARYHDFWSQNFLSFLKLRQKDKIGVLYIEVFLNKAEKQKKQSDTTPREDPPPNSETRRKNWLKMINEHIGKELSVFEKKDLPKIKEKVDKPTFDKILSILKDKDEESDENEI